MFVGILSRNVTSAKISPKVLHVIEISIEHCSPASLRRMHLSQPHQFTYAATRRARSHSWSVHSSGGGSVYNKIRGRHAALPWRMAVQPCQQQPALPTR